MAKFQKYLYEIIEKKNVIKLNEILDKIDGNKKLEKQLFPMIKRNEKILYYILSERNKNDEFLEKIYNFFTCTQWYNNLKLFITTGEGDIRVYLLQELGKAKTSVFFDLMSILRSSQNPEIIEVLADSFSRVEDEESIKNLIFLLINCDEKMVEKVIESLVQFKERVIPYLDKYLFKEGNIKKKERILKLLNKINAVDILEFLLIMSLDEEESIKEMTYEVTLNYVQKLEDNVIEGNKENMLIFFRKQLEREDDLYSVYSFKILLNFKEDGGRVIRKYLENNIDKLSEYKNIILEIKISLLQYLLLPLFESKNDIIYKFSIDIMKVIKLNEEIYNHIIYVFYEASKRKLISRENNQIFKFLEKNNLFKEIISMVSSKEHDSEEIGFHILRGFKVDAIDNKIIEFSKSMDKDMRMMALKLLEGRNEKKFLPHIKNLLFDLEEEIAIKAMYDLRNIDSYEVVDILMEMLYHPKKNLQVISAKLLYENEFKKFIDSTVFKEVDVKKKRNLARIIDNLVEEGIEKDLLKFMDKLDSNMRYNLVNLLGYVEKRNNLTNIMINALKDPHSNIRSLVIDRIPNLDNERIFAKLIFTLNNDPDTDVRAKIVELIGEKGDRRSIDYLKKFLMVENSLIKSNAILALYKLGEKDVLEMLNTMLESGNDREILAGLYVIKNLRIKSKYENIKFLLKDISFRPKDIRKTLLEIAQRFGCIAEIKLFENDKNEDIKNLAKKYLKQK